MKVKYVYLMEMVLTQFQQRVDYPTIERGGPYEVGLTSSPPDWSLLTEAIGISRQLFYIIMTVACTDDSGRLMKLYGRVLPL